MRIGLTATAGTTEQAIRHAQRAEERGFSSLWFASGMLGDPLAGIVAAGRETTSIELGTAVLQTFPCHPALQANRAAATAEAMGRPGFTLGLGPSHGPVIEGMFGYDYAHAGRNTEEYLTIVSAMLAGGDVDFSGADWTYRGPGVAAGHPVPVLVAALGPRLLRVAGEHADGVVLWMAGPTAIDEHIGPRLRAAAEAAGRPAPRIVAGLPVAVHDDLDEARAATAVTAERYERFPNYQRILEIGGADRAVDAAILGDETQVAAGVQALSDAGATELQAFVVPVGDDPGASMRRTMDVLSGLVA